MTTLPPIVWVRMGTWAVGRSPDVLKATLGSCVGIALVWPQQGVCALAHCLLPEAPPGPHAEGARYVDQALRTLLAALAVPPGRRSELQAHLCGGAQMQTTPTPGGRPMQVGLRNIAAARGRLAAEGLVLQAVDTGGHGARQIVVDCASGTVQMLQVSRPGGAQVAAVSR